MLQMRARWTAVLVSPLWLAVAAAPEALAEETVDSESVRIVAPETLNGRPRVVDPELQERLAAMEKNVKDSIPGDETVVAAMYGNPQGRDLVQILAVGRTTADGDRELNAMFQPLRDQGWTVSEVESIDPGPLGGSAKCADVTTPSGAQSVCAWADAQSVGSVTFYLKRRGEAKDEFVGIRSLVEQRR